MQNLSFQSSTYFLLESSLFATTHHCSLKSPHMHPPLYLVSKFSPSPDPSISLFNLHFMVVKRARILSHLLLGAKLKEIP